MAGAGLNLVAGASRNPSLGKGREGRGLGIPDLRRLGRGLGRSSRRLPFSLLRRRPRRNSTRTGRAPGPAEAEATARAGPGPWAPCAAGVMRTEAEAAGSQLEPGQCLCEGQTLTLGTEGDTALEQRRVWPRDLGPTAAPAQAVELGAKPGQVDSCALPPSPTLLFICGLLILPGLGPQSVLIVVRSERSCWSCLGKSLLRGGTGGTETDKGRQLPERVSSNGKALLPGLPDSASCLLHSGAFCPEEARTPLLVQEWG